MGTKVGGGGATGVDADWTGCAAGALVRTGAGADGVGADGVGLSGVLEMDTPAPRPPKGPVISAGTSKCFWAGLRVSELKFNRVRISLSGSTTGKESYSSFTLNRAEAAWRSSPKVILTTPDASCGIILLTATETVARLTSASVSVKRACNCGGRLSRMARSGSSNSLTVPVWTFPAGAGLGVTGCPIGLG
jgi:hypothetical protein